MGPSALERAVEPPTDLFSRKGVETAHEAEESPQVDDWRWARPENLLAKAAMFVGGAGLPGAFLAFLLLAILVAYVAAKWLLRALRWLIRDLPGIWKERGKRPLTPLERNQPLPPLPKRRPKSGPSHV
jgi:hypothetical protein